MEFTKIEAHYLRPGDKVLRPTDDDTVRVETVMAVGRNTMGVVSVLMEERDAPWVIGNADRIMVSLTGAN